MRKAKAGRSGEQKSEKGKFFFLIKVRLTYNITLVSSIQHSDSVFFLQMLLKAGFIIPIVDSISLSTVKFRRSFPLHSN